MTDGEKNFLKFFDAKEAICKGDGRLREEISDNNETIINFFQDAFIDYKTTTVGKRCVICRDIFQVGDRFFAIDFLGIGEDLDEYVNFGYPVEVKPVPISKIIYEEV